MGYVAASIAAGITSLRSQRRFAVGVALADKHLSYEASLVFVGIGERTLQRPVPGSRRLSGARMLYVFVLHEPWRIRMAILAARALTRGILVLSHEHGLHAFQTGPCTVDLRRPEGHVAIDGELLLLRAPLRYTLERDALRVVGARPLG